MFNKIRFKLAMLISSVAWIVMPKAIREDLVEDMTAKLPEPVVEVKPTAKKPRAKKKAAE